MKHFFKKSKTIRQKKKQRKTKKIKKIGGMMEEDDVQPQPNPNINIIDAVDEDDDDEDEPTRYLPLDMSMIADNTITYHIDQKRSILLLNQHLFSIRSIYLDLHPLSTPTTPELQEMLLNENVDILINKLSLNLEYTGNMFTHIIFQNHLNAGRVVHRFLISIIRQHVLNRMMYKFHYYRNQWQFNREMNVQSDYHWQLLNELKFVHNIEVRCVDIMQHFIRHRCANLGHFCRRYNPNNYIFD